MPNGKYYVENKYVTVGEPDCVFLHNIQPESIMGINSPTICFQADRWLPPVFGTRVVSLSRWVDRNVGGDTIISPPPHADKVIVGDGLTVGFISDYEGNASDEVADLFSGIGQAIPEAKFILPNGPDSFRGRLRVRNEIKHCKHDQILASGCDIAIFPWTEDECDKVGDTVLRAMHNGCVPLVGYHGASKEVIPDLSFMFKNAHHAVKLCQKLAYSAGYLETQAAKAKRYCDANYSVTSFRKSLLREIASVVLVE